MPQSVQLKVYQGAIYNTEFQANSQLEGLFGGNPNLDAETSDTLTVGFVAQPSFAPRYDCYCRLLEYRDRRCDRYYSDPDSSRWLL